MGGRFFGGACRHRQGGRDDTKSIVLAIRQRRLFMCSKLPGESAENISTRKPRYPPVRVSEPITGPKDHFVFAGLEASPPIASEPLPGT